MLRSLRKMLGSDKSSRRSPAREPFRPQFERLEERTMLSAVPVPSGLVSWWTGDGLAADPSGGNDAALLGGATFAAGKVGQALSFDGTDDRGQVADAENLKLTDSLSIEAWVKPDSFTTSQVKTLILFRGDDRGGLDPYRLEVMSSGTVRFHVESLTAFERLESPTALPLGEWSHIAATLDGSTGDMRVYINGQLAAETVTSIRPFGDLDPASSPGVGIGNHSLNSSYPFDGSIDELAVYNRALAPDEVLGIYNAGSDGKSKADLPPPTKFYVVNDDVTNKTFEYNADGSLNQSYNLNGADAAPRGAASTAVGDKVWVVDNNRQVYLYHTNGALLGSWTAGTLAANAQPEGIATNGTDIWIVDAKSDKVFKYAGAASRLSGSQNAASSFNLASGNGAPTDIVTDGTSLWVTNDAANNKVFKYSLSGTSLGNWTISGANTTPTGITLDPASPSTIWIVDSGTDKIYEYANAASRTSGSQSAATSYALAAGNTNPQGIADPPVGALPAELPMVGRISKPSASLGRNEIPSYISEKPSRLDPSLAWGATVGQSRERGPWDGASKTGDRQAAIDAVLAEWGADRSDAKRPNTAAGGTVSEHRDSGDHLRVSARGLNREIDATRRAAWQDRFLQGDEELAPGLTAKELSAAIDAVLAEAAP